MPSSFSVHRFHPLDAYNYEDPPKPVPLDHYSPRTRYIRVCHPHYPDHDNLLLTLPLLDPVPQPDQRPADDPPDAEPTLGIHYGTLITACTIVACNMPGCLSQSRDTPDTPGTPENATIEAGWDDVLTGVTSCFYHVVRTVQYIYPTCPSFWHWVFPHGRVPDQWLRAGRISEAAPPVTNATPASKMSGAVELRDRSCRLTLTPDGTENGHIIPVGELDWFIVNGMIAYNLNQRIPGVNDVANGMLLRVDLHRLWDQKRFTFVPKGAQSDWTVHSFQYSEGATRTFHNRPLHRLANIAPEFLYARFAWTVFDFVQAQVQAGRSSRLYRVRTGAGLGSEDRHLSPMNPADMATALNPPSSIRKRKAATEPRDNDLPAVPHRRHSSSSVDSGERSCAWGSSASAYSSSGTEVGEEEDGEDYHAPLTVDMRTQEEVERQAAFLIETEHPAELWGALIPPVGKATDDRLHSAVLGQVRERESRRNVDDEWRNTKHREVREQVA